MKWKSFQFDGTTYDLSHLHPFEMDLIQPSTGDKAEIKYRFLVRFSLHCFTRSTGEQDDAALAYADNRETRTFCFDRYRFSQHLPVMVQDIGNKRCNHTGKGNFFTVEVIDDDGSQVEYEIYFNVTKSNEGKKRPMELFIQSAYTRDEANMAYRHKSKKISFFVIAHNRKFGRPIKTPR